MANSLGRGVPWLVVFWTPEIPLSGGGGLVREISEISGIHLGEGEILFHLAR